MAALAVTGAAFALVGPSGAGKDTLLAGLAQARPDVLIARRIVTRPEESGGEPFEGVSPAEFAARRADFALVWEAHGLSYGIPASLRAAQLSGRTVMFNGARRALAEAARVFAPLTVICLEVAPEVLAHRLAARGRETAAAIAARLDDAALALPPLPAGVQVHRIDNSGPPGQALAALLAVMPPKGSSAMR